MNMTMNPAMSQTMREAMQLMRTGDLQAATAALQRGLAGGGDSTSPFSAPHGFARRECKSAQQGARAPAIDAEYSVIEEPAHVETPPQDPSMAADAPRPVFERHAFECAAGARGYRLFVPTPRGEAPLPLLVMLHGCTQSPEDFATGTRMNRLAEDAGYVVAYPAQSVAANATRCWNWFKPQDQQRGAGEPAIIAELARHLVGERGLDPARVYVAGLSSGGAMANVLAHAYPDVFAAAGVHSGLPHGSARDVPSAFAAMKHAASPAPRVSTRVPTIVFHGDRDSTVSVGNAHAVIEQSAGPGGSQGLREEVEQGAVPGGHGWTRTLFRDASDAVIAERWLVHGAGHAWSGGDAAGSYADPRGPDASREMLRFFARHAVRIAG